MRIGLHVWTEVDDLLASARRLFRMIDGLASTPAEPTANLQFLLGFGPICITEWDEKNGWWVAPV